MRRLYRVIRQLSKIRFLYSVYINFKLLPLKTAVRLPVFIYPYTRFVVSKGAKVIAEDEQGLKFGDIRIGIPKEVFYQPKTRSIILIRGTVFWGRNIEICAGISCTVFRSGVLHLGNNTMLGVNVKVICLKSIMIKAYSRLAHECQVFDTSLHFVENIKTGDCGPMAKNIIIGEYCWVGNRTTVNNGTKLPGHTIVASNSLLNKDYTNTVPEYSLLAGTPAKLIKTGVRRLWDSEKEKELLKKEHIVW